MGETPKVYLAVGHGRRPDGTIDPGATLGSATEQNQGEPIVEACAARLLAAGLNVRWQKAGDPNFPGYTKAANEYGADLAVSVHHDWSGAPRGAFGFWISPEGKRAADAIFRAVERAGFPMRPSWHKRRDNLHFLNNTRMPAVLWECDRVGSVTNHSRYGRALAKGILDYFDWTASEPLKDGAMTPAQEAKLDESLTRLGELEARVQSLRDDMTNVHLRPLRRTARAIATHLGLDVQDGA